MSVDWNDLLVSYLHCPPDKALDIRTHESRALTYLKSALSHEISRPELRGLDDQLAAIAEWLPMPTVGTDGERGILPEDGRLSVRHPICGHEFVLEGCELAVEETAAVFAGLAEGIDDPWVRFLTFWRLLPERLTGLRPWYGRVPSDTRLPDHTIWHHMDTTAGMRGALSQAHGMAFLSLALGPVQPFIGAARSVRDLWTGSAILSWLTFQGLLPVVEEFGPTAVMFPALRGTPMLDVWLRRHGVSKVSEPDANAKKVPCIPNRFLAVVPWGEKGATARELAQRCETAVRDKWKDLTEAVRAELGGKLSTEFPSWDKRWQEQVESFFEIRTAVLPERQCSDAAIAELLGKKDFAAAQSNAAKVRKLAEALPQDLRPTYDQNSSGRWQAQVEMSARLMEAQRMVRHVPVVNTGGHGREEFPPKCSLMGSYEQMGPAGLEESRQFWQKVSEVAKIQGIGFRSRERLCAVALAKRFAAPAFMTEELGIDGKEPGFPDTATMAAAEWLKNDAPEIDPGRIRLQHEKWSGQWLHWERRDLDPEDECPEQVWKMIADARKRLGGKSKPVRPPVYYAALAMDGDSMGKWLCGENAPTVSEVLHSKIREYYERLPGTAEGLAAKRPLGPMLHMALSEALTNFAVRIVPDIVRRYLGTLIYSGGDDLLALLPTRTVLGCADELKCAFSGEGSANNGADEGYYRLPDGRDLLVMGPKATLSAGVAVIHYKEDLREALEGARSAERAAKEGGRDALQLAVWRRSGERASALCAWETVEQLEEWVQAFAEGASDRWVYKLRAELPTLEGLPVEAIQAEIRRQVDGAEEETRRLLGKDDKPQAGAQVAAAFENYAAMRAGRGKTGVTAYSQRGSAGLLGHFLYDFLTLLQSASFLARGRER